MYKYRHPKSGIWYVAFTDPTTRRIIRRTTKTKDERIAAQFFNALKRKILLGDLSVLNHKIQASILISDALKEYIRKKPLSDASVASYSSVVAKFIKDCGDLPIAEIDFDVLQGFVVGRSVNDISRRTYLRHLHAIFAYMHEKKALSEMPDFPKIAIKRKRHPKVLSREQVEQLLAHAEKNDYEMFRYIKFALWTGARRAGIWSLTWERVAEDHCTIILKGGGDHTVPLTKEAKAAMGPRGAGHVFKHYRHIDTITKKFKKIARGCGLDIYHLHHLRHTSATLMLASGIDLHYVQRMLGHAAITTTQIYAEILQERLTAEIDKFRLK